MIDKSLYNAQHMLLTVQEMARADQITIGAGILGADLMEAAGLSVARHVMARYDQVRTIVLCGPGNNGGDGFVAARILQEAGWDITLALLGDRKSLSGDAALMAAKWDGQIEALGPDGVKEHDAVKGHGLVVDAIFGAGLVRIIDGAVGALITKINVLGLNVVAVDVPSGIDGNSGQIRGTALKATSTVTFFRKKPAHLLYPGKDYCGDIEVTDIGLLTRSLAEISPKIFCNDPDLWLGQFPWAKANAHKYNRGHGVVVSGGARHSGAARLAALAALRIGAGLVSVACPDDAILPHAAQLTAVMIKTFGAAGDLSGLLDDPRLASWAIGPGCGVTEQTKSQVLAVLAAGRPCIIDADGLSVFSGQPDRLFAAIKDSGICPILTPHAGEFFRLFPDLKEDSGDYDKLSAAKIAAKRAGAVIIFKGPDTIIASPDGRLVINDNAPPTLATAGSGDVLTGLCLGLVAQGMAPFMAACAAVWIHGAAARAFGPGLISEDIAGQIPDILKNLSQIIR